MVALFLARKDRPRFLPRRETVGRSPLESVDIRFVRLDKFRLCNGQVLIQYLGQFIGQSCSDVLRFSRVDRDGECPTVSVVAIDRPISFPDAIGVTGRMISVADEKNLHPEIGLQLVLRFHRREIITGGNDTAVENNEIVFARDENDLLRLTRSERKSGDEA